MKACPNRIHSDDITSSVAAIDVDRPHDEELFAKEALVFLCGDYGPQDARDDHA
jgi:tRNA G37 N-methylase TrmD